MDKNYYINPRSEMLQYIPDYVSIALEIGCGAGSFGKLLKKSRNNIEIWGIESNEECAMLASTIFDKVFTGTIEQNYSNIPDKQFDCIIFNDVIEHIYDPLDVLKKIKTKLKKNGYIIASIPNVRYLLNVYELLIKKEWKYREQGILDFTHIRFFTKKEIIRLFIDSDYSIEIIEGINGLNKYKFFFINLLTLFTQTDMRYLQFAVVAKKINE